MIQSVSKNQVLDFPSDEKLLRDFDAYVQHLFDLIKGQLGFQSPMLFMHDEQSELLRLVHAPTSLSFSLQHPRSLLIKAYHTQEIQTSRTSQGIFEGTEPEEDAPPNTLFIALPLIVFDESLGVLLLATTQQETLSSLERVFLQNFASQIGINLFTSWALKEFSAETEQLREQNTQFKELIRVKKSFLLNVQELLTRYARQSENKEAKRETLGALSYLNSLLMISDKTVRENETYNSVV